MQVFNSVTKEVSGILWVQNLANWVKFTTFTKNVRSRNLYFKLALQVPK